MRHLTYFIAPSLMLLASVGIADDFTSPALKYGSWQGFPPAALNVQVSTARTVIAVTLNKDSGETPALPSSIGITFYGADGASTTLELRASDPGLSPAPSPNPFTRFFDSTYDPSISQYTGMLSPSAQSFMGFEIQIPWGSVSPVVIRSEDMNRTE